MHALQRHKIDPESEETVISQDTFIAGSFSGTFTTILFQPLDLIKTRLQNRVQNNGMISTTISIIKRENIFGLWRGITPSITRVVPGVGLYFSTLYWLRESLDLGESISAVQAVALGATARTISGAFLIPITVVKTRYESGVYTYKSVAQALRLIHRHEGVKGLSSGLVPTLLRDAPYSGIYLMFYTQLKNLLSASAELSAYKDLALSNFGCGVVSGVLASVVTHPADVLKTKMQLYPNEFKSLKSSINFVYYKYGLVGYFKGIVPRMLRRTLMTAMAWTTYEQITSSIGIK